MKKTPGDIIILHMCTKNYNEMMYGSWDMVCDTQTDRGTEGGTYGWKKWHIEVGAPPKNQQSRFKRIWKPLLGTASMNQAKLVSVIPFQFPLSYTGKISPNPGMGKIWVFPSIFHELGKNLPIYREIYGN